jgi:hypothetical protein
MIAIIVSCQAIIHLDITKRKSAIKVGLNRDFHPYSDPAAKAKAPGICLRLLTSKKAKARVITANLGEFPKAKAT